MNITLTNDKLLITDPSGDVIDFAKMNLSYIDKSKQYQLKRMSKNPYLRTSAAYVALQQTVKGKVFELSGNTLSMPSGFALLFEQNFPNYKFLDSN